MGNCEAGVDCHQMFLYSEVTKVILDDAFPQPGWNGKQNSTLDKFLIIGTIFLFFLNINFLFILSNFTTIAGVDWFMDCTELLRFVSLEDNFFSENRLLMMTFNKISDSRWDSKWLLGYGFYSSSTNFWITITTFLAILNLIFKTCLR